ncbi:MAG: arsenic transporter [Thermoproteota archaeon]|jgi:arsenite-transporting ATPase|uniref:Arsenic transporter n=1 Tax=Candidatus Methanodesulfokora washburnensis TaxID=2478471 RepID=A0A3R9QER8_9CREN|nr:TRC40/GET3/ArsA family transport-energizing ATPase [Candidatus Methanodesulfokores washburnensis]RSN74704.1 arsenic transporter [Candidatus Methanodesulfokores washburnensis]RZN58570.1 MAG: arsenic transporter [Candidatus Methanodesulfokores washburnensis]TDA38958.1 MAG: arsenic transporter [Candidatus Korarchaeota archaeon]
MLSLKEFFEKKPNIKVIVNAGKGGLGKTTSSAAMSYWFAKNGKKPLCFSTDPQASLSDIFEMDIFGKGIIEIEKNLFVVEIDADKRIKEFQEEVRNKIKTMYGIDEIPEEIDEYIETSAYEPAMHESATYDAMADLLSKGEFNPYVFDMPPFGHGVRMVSMARILDAWIDKMEETRRKAAEYAQAAAYLKGISSKTEEDILKELRSIREKLDFFREVLTDPDACAFFMVIIPEKMAILDTERAIEMFRKLDIEMAGVIVNQVYPRELLERPDVGEFLKRRVEMQQAYLKEIKEKFGDYVRAVVPMFDREPKGMEMIAKVAEHLFEKPGLEVFE